jgi:Hydantoinase/oxoprolinase
MAVQRVYTRTLRAGRRAPRPPDRPRGGGERVLGRAARDEEYERTSTTVVNGYLLPAMQRYLADLTAGLARSGVRAPVLVVASNGGVVGARQAAERPVFVVGSGPAAGVTGAARLGAALGEPNLIAFDMAAPLQVRASASNTIRTGPTRLLWSRSASRT